MRAIYNRLKVPIGVSRRDVYRELTDYMLGHASTETRNRIEQALLNPNSQESQLLRLMSEDELDTETDTGHSYRIQDEEVDKDNGYVGASLDPRHASEHLHATFRGWLIRGGIAAAASVICVLGTLSYSVHQTAESYRIDAESARARVSELERSSEVQATRLAELDRSLEAQATQLAKTVESEQSLRELVDSVKGQSAITLKKMETRAVKAEKDLAHLQQVEQVAKENVELRNKLDAVQQLAATREQRIAKLQEALATLQETRSTAIRSLQAEIRFQIEERDRFVQDMAAYLLGDAQEAQGPLSRLEVDYHRFRRMDQHLEDIGIHPAPVSIFRAQGLSRTSRAGNGFRKWLAVTHNAIINFDMSEVQLDHLELDGIRVMQSSLSDMKATRVQCEKASFTETNLTRCRIMNSSSFKRTVFDHCNLAHSEFIDTSLKGVVFKGVTMPKALFRRSDLSEVTFEECDLRDVDLSGCVQDGIYIKNSPYSSVIGLDLAKIRVERDIAVDPVPR
jgi:uncharacterized protein YjbI with pentapeptide repeats